MKKLNIAINGFGRIGRLTFRVASQREDINIVGINDLVDVEHLAYLLKYDSVHGKFPGEITTKNGNLIVNGKEIRVSAEKDPTQLKWDAIDTEVVIDCTGIFKTKESAGQHITAGAKKVVISAPSKDAPMFVMGVNHNEVQPEDRVVSNASCTTNCLAVLAKVIEDNYGIEEALMTTVHATTSTQSTVDAPSKKNYRIGRNALTNIIPTSTGAAIAVGKVIPALDGKLTGMAFRVPTPDVSVVDLTVRTKKSVSFTDLKATIKKASEGDLKGILGYTEEAVVSQDFVSEPRTSVFDAEASIGLNNNFFKLISWYDNEFGYSTKLVDLAAHISSVK
ncbi:type I glyceraldehyde-3-phosphate dehydrogenase [Mesonia sp. K4-1]|uniref:type I glyceraldehyde-3-phosphate dehydrogenase n=1 Tax=Mesonia sp. K4-1 TaxID=2602760 RepID=UPI0011C8991F|nr:type I glyceraldehyde-3-phosphate dehydrogenase [Mesonia sp. K4-1]TXK74932.1 type I glyceraldehyde-3-phosphate dehydrogenase [Mesonia sp. K4-1]